jgi:hypothetical protein
LIEKMIRCENSEVFPAGSVAVPRSGPRLRDDRKRHVDRGAARTVGRDLGGTEIGLTLEKLPREV